MITLYYVQGISAVDEPCCTTLDNQIAFFSKYKVQDIDTGFYPPHFTHEIVLSTEDINLNENVNYLSLDYYSKTYYYFIDSIEYVSENVIKLYVTMDTIQTYMFNIKFLQSDVNRRSINRWNKNGDSYIINRDYLRSNRSKGTMEQKSLVYVDREIGWYVIIINSATTLYIGSEGSRSPYTEANTSGLTNSPIDNNSISPLVNVIAIPVPLSSTYTKLKYNDITYTKYSGVVRLRLMGGVNGVESITYYDQDIFRDYLDKTYSGDTITLSTKNSSYLRQLHFWLLNEGESAVYSDLGWMFAPINILNVPYYYTDISIPSFTRSTSSINVFDSKYVPAMLDENYVQVEFGERIGFASYPLHYMIRSILLYGVCMVNYIDGGRSYYITTRVTIDTYHTLITNTSIEQIALYNDAWQSYLSQNMCTLMRGRSLAYQQIGYQSIMSGFDNRQNNKLFNVSEIQPYTTYSSTGPITTHGYDYNYNYKMMSRMVQAGTNISLQASLYDQSREMQESNMKMQPDNQKVGNSCASDCTSGVLRVYSKVYQCNDFDDVAKDYEQNGYDVALHTSDNLFKLGTRYYYNIVRTDNVEFYLKDIISDNNTISAIKSRFNAGLRLWVVEDDTLHAAYIGDYTYDNTEKSYI